MKQFTSRSGVVSAGAITAFIAGESLTVDGETVEPSPSFWKRYAPQVGVYLIAEDGQDQLMSAKEYSDFFRREIRDPFKGQGM